MKVRRFMLKLLKGFTAVSLSALMAFSAVATAAAAADDAYAGAQVINVSAADLRDGAQWALQSALDQAKNQATASNPVTVKAAAGSYDLGWGLKIYDNTTLDLPPIYINKRNQVLLSLTPRDFSFIAEERLSKIFGVLASYRLKSSLVQTAAISFSLCVDYNEINFQRMIDELKDEYEVLYNTDVELITIRHYTKEIVDRLVGERLVFVEQRNRVTARFVVPAIQ